MFGVLQVIDIDLNKCSSDIKDKIINIRKSISLVTFLSVSYFVISITAFVILLFEYVPTHINNENIKNIFDVIDPYKNFIVVVLLFVVGIINERVYKLCMMHLGYEDKLKSDEKKFALYLVTLVLSFALLSKVLFILIFGIFIGKFIWIDTYLDIKKEIDADFSIYSALFNLIICVYLEFHYDINNFSLQK